MTRGVTPKQRAALRELAAVVDPEAYLAGGVAVALTLGHRTSLDLDLFVPHDFDPERLVERLTHVMRDVRVTMAAPGTLYLEVGDVPTSIVSYRYPLLVPAEPSADVGIRVAGLDDLVCMKLSAIASRGATRDFWDLHALLAYGAAGGTLASALTLYQKKFIADDIGHVVRSLAYFGDADSMPLPRDLTREHWEAIKSDVRRWVEGL